MGHMAGCEIRRRTWRKIEAHNRRRPTENLHTTFFYYFFYAFHQRAHTQWLAAITTTRQHTMVGGSYNYPPAHNGWQQLQLSTTASSYLQGGDRNQYLPWAPKKQNSMFSVTIIGYDHSVPTQNSGSFKTNHCSHFSPSPLEGGFDGPDELLSIQPPSLHAARHLHGHLETPSRMFLKGSRQGE